MLLIRVAVVALALTGPLPRRAAGGPSSTDGQGPTIVSAAAAVRALAKELGHPIEVAPSLASHRTLLVRHGHSASDALQALAHCLRASVVQTRMGSSIVRSEAELNKTRSSQARERATKLAAKLDEIARHRDLELKGGPTDSAISDEVGKYSRSVAQIAASRSGAPAEWDGRELLPSETLLEGLIRRLGAPRIATDCNAKPHLYENGVAGFSSMLPECADLLDQYNLSVERLRQAKPGSDVQREIAGLSPVVSQSFQAWLSDRRPASRLRLRCESSDDVLLVSLECFDALGNRVDSARIDSRPAARSSQVYAQWVQGQPGPDSGVIRLDRSASKASVWSYVDPDALPDWIRAPESAEPLDLFVGPALEAIAQQDPAACVAFDVSDDLWYFANFSVKDDDLNIKSFEAMLVTWGHYVRQSTASEAVWRPEFFDHMEARMADRAALGRYARSYAAVKHEDFRGRAKLLHDASPEPGDLTKRFASLASSGWQDNRASDEAFDALVGGVSDTDWQRLCAGERLPVAELGIAKDLENLVRKDQMSAQGQRWVPDLYRHLSDSLTGADPRNATVEVTGSPETLIRWWRPANSRESSRQFWSDAGAAAGLAIVRYGRRGDELNSDSAPQVLTTRDDFEGHFRRYLFQTAKTTDSKVVLHLPNGCFVEEQIPRELNDVSPALRYEELPQQLRDGLWAQACDAARLRYQSVQAPAGGDAENGRVGSSESKPPPRA